MTRPAGRMVSWGVAAVGALLTGCLNEPDKPNYEFFYPNMVDSVPYDWFDPNPVTKDGLTFMAPPAGSIPRGTMPFAYGPGPEEAARAGRELSNEEPTPTPQSLARGEQLFVRLCSPCHGTAGEGDGPVIPRFPQPPNLKAKHAKELADGQIYHIIMRGQGVMQRYGSQIVPADRWKLVNHIRKLQGHVFAPPPAPTAPSAAAPAPGSDPMAAPAQVAPASVAEPAAASPTAPAGAAPTTAPAPGTVPTTAAPGTGSEPAAAPTHGGGHGGGAR